MSYNSLNDIITFYKKELSEFKLYTKSEKCFLLLPGATCVVWVYKVFSDFAFTRSLIFWFSYFSSLLLYFIFTEKVRKRIIKENQIMNSNIRLNVALSIVRRTAFIKAIKEKFNIKTCKQKELLIEMLRSQIRQPYDIRNLWIVGLAGALIVPIWNTFVEKSFETDFEAFKNNMEAITTIVFTIIIIASTIHFSVIKLIINFVNKNNLRCKQMILILQEDLLVNCYNKDSSTLSGEIILTKVK